MLIKVKNNYISEKDASPSKGGELMGIKLLPDGRTRLKHAYRRADGVATWVQKTINTQDKRKILKALNELIASVEGSLTAPVFSECLEDYKLDRGTSGMPNVFSLVKRALGRNKVDKSFLQKYLNYIKHIKNKGNKTNTISNHKSVIRMVLRYAKECGYIDDLPIKNFNIKHQFRDRIWTEDERSRIFKTMENIQSHLYWSVYFAEKNPLRGKSDQWNLTFENLVEVGKNAPYIKYQPQKTRKIKPRDAYLVLIDTNLLNYFHNLKKCHPDCPYLFPRIRRNKKKKTEIWLKMGNPKKHWNTICKKSNVPDLNYHDLKHTAITYMLDNGFTIVECHDIFAI